MTAAITAHRRTMDICEMGAMKGSSSLMVSQNSIDVITTLMPMCRRRVWFRCSRWLASCWFRLLDIVVNSPLLRDKFAIRVEKYLGSYRPLPLEPLLRFFLPLKPALGGSTKAMKGREGWPLDCQ